jgi:hypothetical protein
LALNGRGHRAPNSSYEPPTALPVGGAPLVVAPLVGGAQTTHRDELVRETVELRALVAHAKSDARVRPELLRRARLFAQLLRDSPWPAESE